ncbi:integrase catalytic domain-containing protein [Trichonephila clavipes]|nr:integrase catalytic domain-containing protein [Trichonephila clavipes]
MWFSGPDLQTDEYEDNQLFPDPSYRDELKCAVTLSMTECSSNFYDELFNVTNNFIKLIRIFSFIFRFINNIKAKESCNKEKYLTADEIKRSTEFLAKIAQLSEFKAEIDDLEKGKGVSKTSKLKALDPFLDENSLLRVGGRLSNADLPFEAKHQIIIPSKHKFTKLLFEHMHKKFFHISAQGLVHQIRMQFWSINGKGIARKTVHDCIACFRQKPTGVVQLMGNLPSERVTPSAPFLNSGVDFCGPFQIKFKNRRKGIVSKVYVAIFVCLATKAIHLEAVTDLTTEAFIAALKRLCARRGRISTLMSDNATNFKGAAAELNRFIKLICNKNETLASYFASEAIQWKFIPPRSPNFGAEKQVAVREKCCRRVFSALKENDLPPCKWSMARILEVIYGTDVHSNIDETRRIACHRGRSDAAIRRCCQERVDNGRFQHYDGSGRPRATADQENRLTVRSTVTPLDSSLSTIRRVPTMSIHRRLRAKFTLVPFATPLPLTLAHCRA